MIRVVIADDHALVRRSLHALLDKESDITVVGEAQNGKEAVKLVRKLEPDLVILDVAMPEMDGITAAAIIHSELSASKIIILSMYSNRLLVRQALKNGANGYLLKRTVGDELLPAVHQILQGEVFLGREISAH